MNRRFSLLHLIMAGANIVLIILFLLVCLIPFVDIGYYWMFTVPGLLFPYLLAGLLFFLMVWLFSSGRRSSKILLTATVITLILGYTQIRAAIGFHFFSEWKPAKSVGAIRVLSWNVSSWDVGNYQAKGGMTYQPLMFDLLQFQDADILCLQEFFTVLPSQKHLLPVYLEKLKERGYPYAYFSPATFTVDSTFRTGLAIYSKYPIRDTGYTRQLMGLRSQGMQYADIQIEDEVIRVFNTHLESVSFDRGNYQALGGVDGSKEIAYKIKNAARLRNEQAKLYRSIVDQSPFPVILCGDFNDVPNSSTYFTLKKDLLDAFVQKGKWLGKTFRHLAPNLRIDYILSDEKFTTLQFNILYRKYSDHYPIVADLISE